MGLQSGFPLFTLCWSTALLMGCWVVCVDGSVRVVVLCVPPLLELTLITAAADRTDQTIVSFSVSVVRWATTKKGLVT